MNPILGEVRFSVKEKLCKHLRRCRNAGVRVRYLIIINLLNDRSAYQTAEVLGVHNTTVYRVARRFRASGEWSLWDAREDNGETKLDEHYLTVLHRVVRATPQQYGWRRPTWTRELLVETLVRETGIRIHVTTMSRALALVEARRGRPRPTVGCPWAKAAKTRCLNAIQRLLATLPRRQVAVYEDEVDIPWCPATIERRAPVFYNSCTPLTTPGTDPSELLPWMTSRLSAARTRTVPTTANAATAISPCVHTTGRSSAVCCIARHARPVFPSAKVPRCSTPACPRTKSSRSSLTSPRAVACGRPAAWSA
jgi:transposase